MKLLELAEMFDHQEAVVFLTGTETPALTSSSIAASPDGSASLNQLEQALDSIEMLIKSEDVLNERKCDEISEDHRIVEEEVWQGKVEWQQKECWTDPQINHLMDCSVFAIRRKGLLDVCGDGWSKTLMMQLIPEWILPKMVECENFKITTKNVKFLFKECKSLELLTNLMCESNSRDEFQSVACLVHFHENFARNILLLLYNKQTKSFIGFIPENQKEYEERFRTVIMEHEMNSIMGWKLEQAAGPSQQKNKSKMLSVGSVKKEVPNIKTEHKKKKTKAENPKKDQDKSEPAAPDPPAVETDPPEDHKTLCWSCHAPSSIVRLLRCRGCRRARYCDAQCHAADWERHQGYCVDKQKRRKEEKDEKTT